MNNEYKEWLRRNKYTHVKDNKSLYNRVRKYNMEAHHRFYYNDSDGKWYRYDGNPVHKGEIERWVNKMTEKENASRQPSCQNA